MNCGGKINNTSCKKFMLLGINTSWWGNEQNMYKVWVLYFLTRGELELKLTWMWLTSDWAGSFQCYRSNPVNTIPEVTGITCILGHTSIELSPQIIVCGYPSGESVNENLIMLLRAEFRMHDLLLSLHGEPQSRHRSYLSSIFLLQRLYFASNMQVDYPCSMSLAVCTIRT